MPSRIEDIFNKRKMMVCSMHGKDMVMQPLIEQYLKIKSEVVTDMNTDEFGTFSGEVERIFDPITALRKKILAGLQISGETLGIGNEGSFGAHPLIPFVPADQEIVMIIDLKNNLEIHETVTSTDTNFANKAIDSAQDLVEFARQADFPVHGLILKQSIDQNVTAIEKGIISWDHLFAAFQKLKTQNDSVTVETDMRAFVNPSRMKVIREATEKLMRRILSACPACRWPGFGVVDAKPGLACGLCGAATRLVKATVLRCEHCNHEEERPVIEKSADPQYCDYCNP